MKEDVHNLQPSSEKDIKVTEKVQRLTGEESTNKPDKNIPHPNKLKCSECKSFKNLEYFSVSKSNKRGYDYRCKECNRKRAKQYHKENKKAILLKWKTKRDNLTKEGKKLMADKSRKWYREDLVYRLFHRAKERAKNNNLEFNIELKDIVIPDKCPLLEVPFVFGTRKEKWYTYSLDRIDNSKGYIKGNIQVITYLANTMKSKASKEELITFCNNILNQFKDDDIV